MKLNYEILGKFLRNLLTIAALKVIKSRIIYNSPTKHIVSDDNASGKSMSAGSTSEFGHESLAKIIDVFKVRRRSSN